MKQLNLLPEHPIVCVDWLDATSEDPWTAYSDIECNGSMIRTVGMLIKENDLVLTVGLNHDVDNNNWSCLIHIPKGMVQNIVKI
jgi:hypothetical protein